MIRTTKLIDDDEGQIVLIPEAFAFAGKVVRIRREGDAVILEPFKDDQGESASGRS